MTHWLLFCPQRGFATPEGGFDRDVGNAGLASGLQALRALSGMPGLIVTRGTTGETRTIAGCHCVAATEVVN